MTCMSCVCSAKLQLLDVHKLYIKEQRCIGWNGAFDSIAAIPHLWRHSQLPLVPHPHAGHPPVPSLDHLTSTWMLHRDPIST